MLEPKKFSIEFYFQKFQKYLSYKKDITELLYFILRQMAADQLRYIRGIVGVNVNTVEIHEKDFKDKVNTSDHLLNYNGFDFVSFFGMEWELFFSYLIVLFNNFSSFLFFIFVSKLQAKQIDVFDLRSFYESKIFKDNNFVYDSGRKLIVQVLPTSQTAAEE